MSKIDDITRLQHMKDAAIEAKKIIYAKLSQTIDFNSLELSYTNKGCLRNL